MKKEMSKGEELFFNYYTACSKNSLRLSIRKQYFLTDEQNEDVLQEGFLYFYNSIRKKESNSYKIYKNILEKIEHEELKDKEFYSNLAYMKQMANSGIILGLRKILGIKDPVYIKDEDSGKFILKQIYEQEKKIGRKLTIEEKELLKNSTDNLKIHYSEFNEEVIENIPFEKEIDENIKYEIIDKFYNSFYKDTIIKFIEYEYENLERFNFDNKLNALFYKKLSNYIINKEKVEKEINIDEENIKKIFENLCLYSKDKNKQFLETKLFKTFKEIFNF